MKISRLVTVLFYVSIVFLITHCDTLKKIPTNTSGTFSLNGNWQLIYTSDMNNALSGTVVQVIPGIDEATVSTLNKNTLCLRERDVLWRKLKARKSGVFAMENLATACTTTVYQPGTITFLSNDEIKLISSTASGTELIQMWQRVSNNL